MTNKTKEKLMKSDSDQVAFEEQVPIISDSVEKVNIVLAAKAVKLNPKSGGCIYFEIKLEGSELHLRMKGNDSGGLYSKEWIAVKDILTILDGNKSTTDPFNSKILKSLFKSGSANNVSFLAGILRCEELALIAAVPSKMYSHKMNENYDANKKRLLALASIS